MNIYKCKQCGGCAAYPSADSHALLKCPYCGHADYAIAWRDSRSSARAARLEPNDLHLIKAELEHLPASSDMANGAFNALSRRFGLSTFALMQIANVLCAPAQAEAPDAIRRLHRFAPFAPGSIDGAFLLQRVNSELARMAQSAPAPSPAESAQSPWEQKYAMLQKEHERLKAECAILRKNLDKAFKEIHDLKSFG